MSKKLCYEDVLKRWLRNKPTEADLIIARRAIARPEVAKIIRELDGELQKEKNS